jgi:hypothetical protein
MAVASVDASTLAGALDRRGPRRTLAAFALVFPLVLAGAWLRDIVSRTLAGQFGYPVGPAALAHVVHALDLGLRVPLGLATGVMLLRREPAGWWVGGILLVQALDMSAALTAMVATSSVTSGGSVVVAAPFALLCVFCAVLSVAFYRVTSTSAS